MTVQSENRREMQGYQSSAKVTNEMIGIMQSKREHIKFWVIEIFSEDESSLLSMFCQANTVERLKNICNLIRGCY